MHTGLYRTIIYIPMQFWLAFLLPETDLSQLQIL